VGAANRQSVLIVDDEPANIQIIGDILQDECDLYFARSGAEALRMVEEKAPDLILLDVMMPGMDGFEVCRRLKAAPATQDIPVLFITALGATEDETHGFDVGAVDYITKPVSLPAVRARVRVHLKLKRTEDLLRQSALIDGLTGIANRRRLDEALALEWRRAHRTREPLSVIMADVDVFKSYNDRYGHVEGDVCLRRVAQALAKVVRRPGDLAARYGGEEFVCVLPSTDLDGAMAMAERMRDAVLAQRIAHEGSPVSPWVTLSLGVVAGMATDGHGLEDLLRLADGLLYRAKAGGRNRVEGALLDAPRSRIADAALEER